MASQPDVTTAQAAPDDHEVARQVADAAGRLLLELRAAADPGADPQLMRDEGDRRSNDLIMGRLAQLRPDDAVLSEEAKDTSDRLHSTRVWIIDPLDGTREFGEPPRDDWAVHVALCVDGVPVVGAVALPAQGRVFATGGAATILPAPAARPRIVASRTRAPALVNDVAAALDGDIVPMGSAGAKAMAILSGQADVYVHAGGQYEWDSAAPVAVASAAGLHCSRINGAPLLYNNPEPYLPDLVICRPELADAVLAAVQESLESAVAQASTDARGGRAVEGRGV